MKIRTLVITRLIPVFAMLALVLGVIFVLLVRGSVEQNQQVIMNTAMASIDDQLQATRFRARSTGELLLLSDEVLHYSVSEQGLYRDVGLEPRVLHLFQQAITTYGSLKSIGLADNKQQLLLRVAENYDPNADVYPQEAALITKLQETGQTFAESFTRERGSAVINYALSIDNDLAARTGKSYLLLQFNLDSVAAASERLWKENQILLVLRNDRGQVITAPERFRELVVNLSIGDMQDKELQHQPPGFKKVTLGDSQYSFLSSNTDSYQLIAMVPMQVINSMSTRFATIALAVIGGFLLLGVVLVALFVKRHLVQPIARLTEVVQRRAGGDDVRFEQPSAAREIKDLAETFEGVVAAEQKARSEIQSLAYYDTLTGLVNRRLFIAQLTRAVASSRREDQSLAVLFMDLDNFKAINDAYGHHYGDKVLVEFAKRLVQTVRSSDLVSVVGDEADSNPGVARFAGDEFAILLTGLHDSFTAAQVVERLLENVRKPFVCEDQEFNLTASIGIAAYPDDAQSAQQLMEHADAAMYQAKLKGKNTYCFFSGELSKQLERQRRIQEALRYALQQDEFQLLFQPYIDKDDHVCGAEVLLRWHSKALGAIQPSEFIPMAEANGMIRQIDTWVTLKSMEVLRAWQEQELPSVKLSVNLSGLTLRGQEYLDLVVANIKAMGISPDRLELEIDEHELVNPDEDTLAALHSLKKQGVGLVLDDFGKGMTSLSQLKDLPVDRLKLNQQSVNNLANMNLAESTASGKEVDAILALSRAYQLPAMAKGVEDSACADYLKKAGCDYLQGYYFSKPITREQFEDLLGQDRLIPAGEVSDKAADNASELTE